jgi:hypothetical protein
VSRCSPAMPFMTIEITEEILAHRSAVTSTGSRGQFLPRAPDGRLARSNARVGFLLIGEAKEPSDTHRHS